MHRLEYRRELEPSFLKKYRRSRSTWEELAVKHHDDHYLPLCEVLAERQNGRCAYCECRLAPHEKGKRHIDHFIPRGRRADLTFSWTNLVLSCDNDLCCGRNKDKDEFKGKKYLHPYESDGRRYLRFATAQSQCTAYVREGLSEAEKIAAQDTIDAYGLNSSSLCHRRANRVRAIAGSLPVEQLEEMMRDELWENLRNCCVEELSDLINQALEGEFCSACIDGLVPQMNLLGVSEAEIDFSCLGGSR